MTVSAQAETPVSRRLDKSGRRAVFASTIGTIIEFYDFALYGVAAALIIGPLFFPDSVPGVGTILAFATFAVGFVVRPLGGLIIAHLGDTLGRKPALLLTVVLMGAATTGIGFLPTADQIGIWAPILLVTLRAIQGFGAGAELAGALTIVSEYTPDKRRGFYTGIINGVAVAGSSLAMLVFLAVTMLPDSALMGWGWRVPFMLSAVLFLLAVFIRNKLDESPEYQKALEVNDVRARRRMPISDVIRSSPRRAILAILMWTGQNANGYIVMAFSVGFLTSTAEMSRPQALAITMITTLIGCATSPLWGLLGDELGHARVFSAVMMFGAVFALPFFWLLETGSFWLAFVGMFLASVITMGGGNGNSGAVTTGLFPAEFRFSGVAVSKEVNAAVIAGPTPFIAAALVATAGGSGWMAAVFLSVCCLITVLAIWGLRRAAPSLPATTGSTGEELTGRPSRLSIGI